MTGCSGNAIEVGEGKAFLVFDGVMSVRLLKKRMRSNEGTAVQVGASSLRVGKCLRIERIQESFSTAK